MKEQIIIDGEKYNKCNGCKLWDGYICTGDRSYEPNAEAHRAICNEHMAKEFWKVYHELFYKTQECNTLKSQLDFAIQQKERFEQECEALKSEGFTRESLITLQEDELQLGEQLINGILKTLNLEAYDWRADQNEIIMEIKTFEEKYEALKLENQEGYEIVDELKQECEQKEKELKELKRQYKLSCLDCEYKNTKADVNRYRKALGEIEEYVRDNSDFDKSDILTSKTGAYDILDIINKAKGDNR